MILFGFVKDGSTCSLRESWSWGKSRSMKIDWSGGCCQGLVFRKMESGAKVGEVGVRRSNEIQGGFGCGGGNDKSKFKSLKVDRWLCHFLG